MSPLSRVLAAHALPVLMASVLVAPVAWAQEPQTLTLSSGDGPVGTLDPSTEFTLDGSQYQNAHIIDARPAYAVIPGTRYISLDPNSAGPWNAATRYRVAFILPEQFSNPSLTVQVHADNVATVFVNGVQFGQQPFGEILENFQDPASAFTLSDAAAFHSGVNYLEFEIYNFWGPTAFNYKATVTYNDACTEPEAPTLVLSGDSEMTLECGVDTWADPGAQAYDACGPLEVHRYNSGSDPYGPGPLTSAEGSYSVQYAAWNAMGNTVSAIRTVHVDDRLAPTLVLKGPEHMTHPCGSAWVDPGVEATDACYGDVVATVVRAGDFVNGWVEGVYTVHYGVTDSGGNSAEPVTRTVEVVDCPW